MAASVDSVSYFWSHRLCWKLLGAAYKQVKYQTAYIAYALLMNVFITVCYPLHLIMSVMRNGSVLNDVKNLTTIVTCTACSLKFVIYAMHMHKVSRIEALLRQLDARVTSVEERHVYQRLQQQVRYIFYIFFVIYMPCGITAELSFIYQEQRGLMYPAWFPFDWRNSTRNFYIANVYQAGGIFFQLTQNFVSDCFPPVVLCLISGHIQLLGMRLARIGHDPKSTLAENDAALERCIVDQQNLYELFQNIADFMSLPMLIQFTVTAFNVCISLATLMFFATAPMDRLYFGFYFMAMPLQIFPTCYFGTDNELKFAKLHYAAFSSNWMDQSRNYRKNLIFFMERSLRTTTAVAGGMLRVHVDTFFSTLKGAYSLFAVIIRLKS